MLEGRARIDSKIAGAYVPAIFLLLEITETYIPAFFFFVTMQTSHTKALLLAKSAGMSRQTENQNGWGLRASDFFRREFAGTNVAANFFHADTTLHVFSVSFQRDCNTFHNFS